MAHAVHFQAMADHTALVCLIQVERRGAVVVAGHGPLSILC